MSDEGVDSVERWLEDLDFKGLRKLLAGEQVYFVWEGLKEDSEVSNVDGIGNLLWT